MRIDPGARRDSLRRECDGIVPDEHRYVPFMISTITGFTPLMMN